MAGAAAGLAIIPRGMAADDILEGLRAHGPRPAGSDAERRAALWLSRELQGSGRVRIETFWCHPNWALAAAWHVLLGLVGSLISVSHPKAGGVIVLAAILSLIADALFARSPGRLLTPLRATQNVVWSRPGREPEPPVTLILTAGLDTPRTPLLDRPVARRLRTRLRSLAGATAPGWSGWLVGALLVVLGTAIARSNGDRGGAIGIAQLVPTVVLVLALAFLLEAATAAVERADATAVAAAVALAHALAAAPPGSARVELLLQGAASGSADGLRHHLRSHRRTLTAPRAVVLGVAAAGEGPLGWWASDGPLVPLRPLAPIRRLAKPGLRAVRGRGVTAAYPALVRRIPGLTIGTLATGTNEPAGTGDAVDRIRRAGLALADEIDVAIAARRAAASDLRPA